MNICYVGPSGEDNISFAPCAATIEGEVRNYQPIIYNCSTSARLFLIGSWTGSEEYRHEVQTEIFVRGLDDKVFLTGKVSASQLAAYHRSSDVLLCASEHEGFCVPLLEAMSFDL